MKRFLSILCLLLTLTGFAASPINKATVLVNTNGVLIAPSTNFFDTNKTALLLTIGSTYATPADVIAATNGIQPIAYTAISAYATAAQGTNADTAVQPADLATVATTGDYNDLINKPSGGGSSSLAWSYIEVTNRVLNTDPNWVDLTNMNITITNQDANSWVLVSVTPNLGGDTSYAAQWRVMCIANGATNEVWPNSPATTGKTSMLADYNANNDSIFNRTLQFMHHPGTNTPIYFVQWKAQQAGAKASFNISVRDTTGNPYSIISRSNMRLEERRQ